VPQDAAQGIEVFSSKIGLVLLVLGVMHFFNLFLFSRVRRRALLQNAAPPVAPQGYLAPVGSEDGESAGKARGGLGVRVS
jgi:hypothetical protein